MDNSKEFYNLIAPKTTEEWYNNSVLEPSLKEFINLLPNNPKVLDYGCGQGHESYRLIKLGATVVGIDYSEVSINIAKEKNPNGKFYLMDFSEVDKNIGIFDGIFASGSIIHIPQNRLENYLSILSSIHKNNGIFIIIVQDGTGKKQYNHKIDGLLLKRQLYLYNKDLLLNKFQNIGYEFIKEGILDKTLIKDNWRSYLFIKK